MSTSFAEIVGSFLRSPYKAGGVSSEGYDCLGFVCRLCQACGRVFPENFGAFDKDNYRELYMTYPKKATQVMLEFFDSFAERIDLNRIVAGDLVVIKQNIDVLFPAVYTGSGKAVSSFINSGVTVFPTNELCQIKIAWRLKWAESLQD